jgi:hypothetical protein
MQRTQSYTIDHGKSVRVYYCDDRCDANRRSIRTRSCHSLSLAASMYHRMTLIVEAYTLSRMWWWCQSSWLNCTVDSSFRCIDEFSQGCDEWIELISGMLVRSKQRPLFDISCGNICIWASCSRPCADSYTCSLVARFDCPSLDLFETWIALRELVNIPCQRGTLE